MKYTTLKNSVLSPIRALFIAAICAFSFSAFAAPVDINTASAEQISESLAGVGPAKAQAIIAYRTANGPFLTADQLSEVKGIGPATVEKNRASILVSKPENKAKK